jgi:hypothetical protein
MKRPLGRSTPGPAVWMRAVALALLLHGVAEARDVTVTPIARDGQVLVSFDLSDGFTADVRDAIQSGLPTTFSYVVELRQGSATWFDRTLSAVTIAATVRFDNLTRRYQMSRAFGDRVEDAPATEDLDAVRRWMTHFERVPVSATSSLQVNGEYYIRVRVRARHRDTWFLWPWDRLTVLGRGKFTFIR